MSKMAQLKTITKEGEKCCADGRGLKLARVPTANVNKSAPNGTELVPRIFMPLSL